MHRSDMLALGLLAGAVFLLVAAVSGGPKGLNLEASHKTSIETKVHVLTISGTIVNTSSKTLLVPNVRVALRDERSAKILVRETPPSRKSLSPGARATFGIRFEYPPENAVVAEVDLVGVKRSPLNNLPWE